MKGWLAGAVAAGLVATGVGLVAAVPGSTLPEPPRASIPDVATVCPGPIGTERSIRLAAGGAVGVAPLGRPEAMTKAELDDVAVSGPSIVTGPAAHLASVAGTGTGAQRGVAAAACVPARGSQWLVGIRVGQDASAEVLLLNPDAADAAVDLTLIGPEGVLVSPGGRGLVVAAHGSRSVPLGPLVARAALSRDAALAVRVETSQGRVAAFGVQHAWSGTSPAGVDWIGAAADPAKISVVPAVPGGKGERLLVVTNPTDRIASVDVGAMGDAGIAARVGADHLDVPAKTTRTLALTSALGGEAVGLRLNASQPVTAAVWATNADARIPDFALSAATTALPAQGSLALANPTTLRFANPSASPATVSVELGAAGPVRIRVAAGASAGLTLRSAGTVRWIVDSDSVYAAVTVDQASGSRVGLGIVGLNAPIQSSGPNVSLDPGAARG